MKTNPQSDVHGVLVVDKASGPTSHDAVAVTRRALGTRAVGHTGTLDPMASGVLVMVVGEATKLVNLLVSDEKRYEATVRFGAATSTLDAQGEVVETAAVPALERAHVQEVAARFLGEIEQRPPSVSAIKVDGKSLYKRVRAGEQVEAPLRRVRLESLEVLSLSADSVDLRLSCGKGFYVRSLALDLARALGTVGHLTALRRTQNGGFCVEQALTFDALRAAARGSPEQREQVRERLVPLRQVCLSLPHRQLDARACEALRHGRSVPIEDLAAPLQELPEGEAAIALDETLAPIAIVTCLLGALRVLRGFRGG